MPISFDNVYFEGDGDLGYSNYGTQHGYLDAELAFVLSAFGPTFGKVLDAGCGYGYFTEMLRAEGINAQGIDVSAFAVGQDVSGGFISELSFLRNPNTGFADGEFDLVLGLYVLECLEKLADIRKAVREAKRIGARFYFVTSLASPVPHYNTTQADYEAFVENEFPAPTWSVSWSDGVAFQPARRCVIVPGT